MIFHFCSARDFELILFAAGWYAFCPDSRNCSKILRYKKYTKYTDCYRLVCFWQILFLLCWFLILMKLWLVSGGTIHGKVRIQYPNTNIDRIQVCYSTKRSGSLFSCTNVITSFCLSFVLWSFQVLGDVLMDKEIRSGKSSSLGMPKASQAKFKDTKKPKIGDAPGRHPLFRLQSIRNITWGYIFIHHMLCVFAWSILYRRSLLFLLCHNHPCCTPRERDMHSPWFCRASLISFGRQFSSHVLHLYLLS